MIRVDVPEHGTFVDFPDGTPPAEIEQVLAQNFPPVDARAKFIEQESANSEAVKGMYRAGTNPSKSSLLRRAVGDTAISALKGAIGLPESVVGLADIVTGGMAGQAVEKVGYRPKEAKAILDTMYSPEQQEANAAVQSAEGFVPTLKAAVQNPSTIFHSAVESAPSMIGGAGIARGGMKILPKLAPVVAGALGEGAISAGQTAEQVRQEDPEGRLSLKQSALAAGSGALTGAISLVGGRVAQKLGITDIDTFLASGAAPQAKAGLVKSVAEGLVSEGFEESAQSAQEQIAQNVAQGKPWSEGVGNATAMGGITGGVMGGGGNVIGHGASAPQPAPAGPLSRAVGLADVVGPPEATEPVQSVGDIVAQRRSAEKTVTSKRFVGGNSPQPASTVYSGSPASTPPPVTLTKERFVPRGVEVQEQPQSDGAILRPEITEQNQIVEVSPIPANDGIAPVQPTAPVATPAVATETPAVNPVEAPTPTQGVTNETANEVRQDERQYANGQEVNANGEAAQGDATAVVQAVRDGENAQGDEVGVAQAGAQASETSAPVEADKAPESQQNINAQIAPVAGLSEPGDSQVSPEVPAEPAPAPKQEVTATPAQETANEAPPAEVVPPTQPQTAADEGPSRGILQTLAKPKKKSDASIAALAAQHGKDDVNRMVTSGYIAFPGRGMAELTKKGRAWLESNPAPLSPLEATQLANLAKNKKRSEKQEAKYQELSARQGEVAAAEQAVVAPKSKKPVSTQVKATAAEATALKDVDALIGQDGGDGLPTREEIRAAFADEPTTPEQPKAATTVQPKIDDFGEKIGGARKDYAAKFESAKNLDVATEPFAKTWPEPDYNKMIADGTDHSRVSLVRALRDEIPDKPRKSWKLKSWVAMVENLRNHAERSLAGDSPVIYKTLEKMEDTNSAAANIRGRVELYEAVGHGVSLKGITLKRNHWALWHGEKDVTKWQVEREQKATAFGNMPQDLGTGDTKAEAIEKFKANLDKLQPAPAKGTTFVIYSKNGQSGYFIGKKIGRDYVDLKTFGTVPEARTYLKEHQADLEAQLEKMKTVPYERRQENAPRKGKDARSGKDATPEMFQKAYGFRGVEFGNYLNAADRQRNLNEAFDALHDLAEIVGVPTKALSLNGELGLAFGARGHGGKNAPKAHYESGKIAINLTKNNGAGSLAHEWFHALDSYFSRKRGYPNEFITNKTVKYGPQDATRQELVDAFKNLKKVLDTTNLKERSRNLDKTRTKDYWSTGIEMHARAFENYVIDKLAEGAKSNDYLANIKDVSEYANDLLQGFFDGKTVKDLYPYLMEEEKSAVSDAFDNLFSVMQHEETEKGVALYSTADSTPEPLTLARVQSSFPTLPITEKDGVFTVTAPSGVTVRISKVGEIEFDRKAAELAYGREIQPGEVPVAEFKALPSGAVINLTERGVGVLDHEVFHAGMALALNEKQRAAVLKKFGTEENAAAEYQRLKDTGAFEEKKGHLFLNAIYRFFRNLRQLIAPTAKGVMQDVASGKVWGKAKQGESGPKYALSRADQTMTDEQKAAVEAAFGKPKTLKERAKEFKKDLRKNLEQGIFDQYAPIKDLDMGAYMKARMTKGGDSTLEAVMLYGKPYIDSTGSIKVDFSEKNNGQNGFASILAELDGEHDRFLKWVAGIRAGRLKDIGLENLMSKETIAALKTLNRDGTAENKLPNGEDRAITYMRVLNHMNAYNDAILKVAVERGLINDATRQMYKDMPYIPFYRLQDEGVVTGFTATAGLVNQTAWKKLKGGTNKLNDDMLANMLKNWSHLITASARNEAAAKTLTKAVEIGAAHEVPAGYPGKGIVSFRENTTTVLKKAPDGTYKRVQGEPLPQGTKYKEGGVDKVSDGTVVPEFNVERHFIVTGPHLLDAITSIGPATKAPKVLRGFKNVLTHAVTINPTFKIRNLIRDSVSSVALADMSYNPVKNVKKGFALTAHGSETRAQMMAAGGIMRFGSMLDGASADNARKLIDKGVPAEHILDSPDKVSAFWKKYVVGAFDAYQEFGDRSEQVNRAALYQTLLEKGYTADEAAFWARDLMDFSMSGKWAAVRFLTQTVPFMNARLQGLYKLGRAAKADRKRFAYVIGGVTLSSLALLAAYHDDDDWKKREAWDRDNYWWFKVGDKAFRIPKPFEIGAIGSVAEWSAELMFNDEMTGGKFAQRMRDIVSSQLSLNPTPQLVKPLIDLWANKDSFTNRPIETMGMDRLKPEDRYSDYTSGAAKVLGQLGLPNPAQVFMGRYEPLSPVQIDSLVRGYFSWLGVMATTALDYGVFKPLSGIASPTPKLKDVFMVGNFVEGLPSNSSRYVSEMYEQSKEIEQSYNSYRAAVKAGDTERAANIMASDKDNIKKHMQTARIQEQVAELNRRIKQVTASRFLSGDQKREKIDALRQKQDAIARRMAR